MNFQPQYLILVAIVVIAVVAITRSNRERTSLAPASDGNPMNPANWTVGPIVDGKNLSRGMPLHPTPCPEGWMLDMSAPTAEPHYVIMMHGSLEGASALTLQLQTRGGPFVPVNGGEPYDGPAWVSMFLQRKGDDWRYKPYRWFSSTVQLNAAGIIMVAPLTFEHWRPMMGENTREAFDAAIRECECVGFVLGGPNGVGHGVFATKPSQIIVRSFGVEYEQREP